MPACSGGIDTSLLQLASNGVGWMPRLCCHLHPRGREPIRLRLRRQSSRSSRVADLPSPSWRTSACPKSIRLRMSRSLPNGQFINSGLTWGNGYASELATWEVGEQTQTYRQRTGDGGMFAWPLGSEAHRHERPSAPCSGSVSLFGPLSRTPRPLKSRYVCVSSGEPQVANLYAVV